MSIQVQSEVGRLRRVLVHRPGQEIDRMIPAMMEQLLFDDILFGEEARAEHDGFCGVLRAAGVEVLEAERLLAEVLGEAGPRAALLAELGERFGVRAEVVERLGDRAPEELARDLVAGVRRGAEDARAPFRFFDLSPLPNYFFQRDPQVVLGDRVLIASMATDAREREPLLARTLFDHHPALGGARGVLEIAHPPHEAPERDPDYRYPTLEGGDVLVASPHTVLVGLSERTNRRGAESLAEQLRRAPGSFRHLVLVDLPRSRSCMHLDTVFTLIDRQTCLAHLPVIEEGHAQTAPAYCVDLASRHLTFTLAPSLLAALAELGEDLEVVPCGGSRDSVDQDREQWTDGANAFALAPGVILLYRRNRRTLEELADRGWRVLSEEQVLAGGVDLLGHGPTVVTILDHELSRARGGPHCMTMPLEREP